MITRIDYCTADCIPAEFIGLTTDTKPDGVANASSFFEMDTGKAYLFDAENRVWRNKADGTPVAGGDLITFTVNGTEYAAEPGMTWAELIESEYNPNISVENQCCSPDLPTFSCECFAQYTYVYYNLCGDCGNYYVIVDPDGNYEEIQNHEIIAGGAYTTKFNNFDM